MSERFEIRVYLFPAGVTIEYFKFLVDGMLKVDAKIDGKSIYWGRAVDATARNDRDLLDEHISWPYGSHFALFQGFSQVWESMDGVV